MSIELTNSLELDFINNQLVSKPLEIKIKREDLSNERMILSIKSTSSTTNSNLTVINDIKPIINSNYSSTSMSPSLTQSSSSPASHLEELPELEQEEASRSRSKSPLIISIKREVKRELSESSATDMFIMESIQSQPQRKATTSKLYSENISLLPPERSFAHNDPPWYEPRKLKESDYTGTWSRRLPSPEPIVLNSHNSSSISLFTPPSPPNNSFNGRRKSITSRPRVSYDRFDSPPLPSSTTGTASSSGRKALDPDPFKSSTSILASSVNYKSTSSYTPSSSNYSTIYPSPTLSHTSLTSHPTPPTNYRSTKPPGKPNQPTTNLKNKPFQWRPSRSATTRELNEWAAESWLNRYPSEFGLVDGWKVSPELRELVKEAEGKWRTKKCIYFPPVAGENVCLGRTCQYAHSDDELRLKDGSKLSSILQSPLSPPDRSLYFPADTYIPIITTNITSSISKSHSDHSHSHSSSSRRSKDKPTSSSSSSRSHRDRAEESSRSNRTSSSRKDEHASSRRDEHTSSSSRSEKKSSGRSSRSPRHDEDKEEGRREKRSRERDEVEDGSQSSKRSKVESKSAGSVTSIPATVSATTAIAGMTTTTTTTPKIKSWFSNFDEQEELEPSPTLSTFFNPIDSSSTTSSSSNSNSTDKAKSISKLFGQLTPIQAEKCLSGPVLFPNDLILQNQYEDFLYSQLASK